MRRPRFPAVALPLALAAGGAAADGAAPLEALLEGMTSYRATFSQTVLNRFGEALQESTGTMHLKRPGRMRWEVDEPYPQLVLADGERLWVYDPDLEQATVQPLADVLAGSPASFLAGGAARLAPHFAVRMAEPAQTGGQRFVLTPRDDAATLRSATVAFTPRGMLAGLDIVDHADRLTRIVFADGSLNPALEPTLFAFEPPPGVDVIGDVQAPRAIEPAAR